MKLPTLYKITKTGATQVFNISVKDNVFTVEWGQLNGAMQTKSTECFVTNEGRSNERSPAEQAKFEAAALHAKKIKTGYTESLETPSEVELPMKVKIYQDQINNVVFPCVSTPKLNGLNGMYVQNPDGTLTLYSRGGEVLPAIPHLEESMLLAMEQMGSKKLNGELFIENTHLQDIASAVKKPKELSKQLTFHVFDIADSDEIYEKRLLKMLQHINTTTPGVYHISVTLCYNHEDIETEYNKAMSKNYEGTVIKNLTGLYVHNTRSSDQFKYKKTRDAEFSVISYSIDKNGHAVYVCITPDRLEFKVKRKGTNGERLADASVADSNIGKWLRVEFEEYSKDGIPLKPVGCEFRNCNSDGQPLE